MSKKKLYILIAVVVFLLLGWFSGFLKALTWHLWLAYGVYYGIVTGIIVIAFTLWLTRKMWVWLPIAIIILLSIGGCYMQEDTDMKRAEEVAKSFLEENYMGVESIKVTNKGRNPMGHISVGGYVNDAPEMNFGVTINDEFEVSGVTESKVFLEWNKEDE